MNATQVSARELAVIFVETLNLQDIDSSEIDLAGPLFGSGLGLDSLDMLEIALVVEQRFGLKLKADDPQAMSIFGSLQSLSGHINQALAGN